MRIGLIAMLSFAVGASAALAQSASVTAGGNGQVSGSTSVPGLPPISVTAGNGQVTTTGPALSPGSGVNGARGANGHSVTVRSPDGASSTSVWTSGGGNSVVAGSGSPGSTVTYDNGRRYDAARREDARPRYDNDGRGPPMTIADYRPAPRSTVRQLAYRRHHARHVTRRRHHHHG